MNDLIVVKLLDCYHAIKIGDKEDTKSFLFYVTFDKLQSVLL